MSKNTFAASDLTMGQLNAIVKKLGGHEGALKFLRGELALTEIKRLWREENGVIYLSVTSDGTTGPEWIKRLEDKGFRVSYHAKQLLNSSDFAPTTGVTYNLAVLKGKLFTDKNRVTSNIRANAEERKLIKPNAEVACLLREALTDQDIEAMGLWWIVAMHDPIKDSDGDPLLLDVGRDYGGQWLGADYGEPDDGWLDRNGFAFIVSQVGPQD